MAFIVDRTLSENRNAEPAPAVFINAADRIEGPEVVERPARPAPQPTTIGLSAASLRNPVANMVRVHYQDWSQRAVPLENGTPRIVGESKGLILELIGRPENLDQATLILILNAADAANMRALVVCIREFLKAAFPGPWEMREAWIRDLSVPGGLSHANVRRKITAVTQQVGPTRVITLKLVPA